ncbi:MAG: aminoglycoside phosphotransferase family protein [Lentisphaeria bacterium]|nr:aminoglycoside phosphotransferase family protein [Lentisphaeria bacterium]
MATPYTQREIRRLIGMFDVYGDFLVGTPFGNGNVNDTFQLTFDQGGIRLHYILQRINSHVFKEPIKVMENVARVTDHLLKKIRASHQETKKRTIRLLNAHDGRPFAFDDCGNCWRAYIFVEHARAYEVLESPEQAFRVAQGFGEFQRQLVDFNGRLHETIPDFHNTPKRVAALEAAVKADVCNRAKEVEREIDFVLSRKDETDTLIKLNASGDIPERITHNDTKANNILIDDLSGEAVCVIDLDTVMPGLSLYDFGDMVRSGTNPAEEDEINLDKVGMRFDMYKGFYEGFVDAAGKVLTPAEKEYLPFSGKLITLEIGMRFLTDYLSGDVYFKTRRPRQNLDRCRTQFKLVESMEAQMKRMKALL